MKFLLVCAVLGSALLVSVASAQEPAQATSPQQAGDSDATVYVYRYKQYVGKALSPSVYCDGNELARMENGRFFVVKVPAGAHVFSSNDKQAGIDVNLKPGEQYYIRVELATGFLKGHGRLVSMAPEQGAYEIKKLKPLDSDKVKDTQHVSLTLGSGT
jgi:hypothetical protein